MKLCRYGKNGFEKPGMVDGDGRLRDLSKVVQNIGPNELSPRGLQRSFAFVDARGSNLQVPEVAQAHAAVNACIAVDRRRSRDARRIDD